MPASRFTFILRADAHCTRRCTVSKAANQSSIPYGLTNKTEFFPVAAEYFFEKPEQLQHQHAELYQQLSQISGQAPINTNGQTIG
jgi:Mlc titration factor MtfA (ptsG expression regulator)